jgi:hypothetical protein
MGNVDWSCLAIQVAITGIAFYLVNMLILYKDVNGKAPTIKRDDMNLFLSLLLAILVGYWATTYVKPDCVSIPYTKQEGKERFLQHSLVNPDTLKRLQEIAIKNKQAQYVSSGANPPPIMSFSTQQSSIFR